MPNLVPAAAEGLPGIQRRTALAVTGYGLVAALTAACTGCQPLPAPADPQPDLSPIMTLFREWEANYHACSADAANDECNAHMDRCREIEARLMRLPSTSAEDFAAKFIVSTLYGDWIEPGDLLSEAKELVKGGAL
jgi:hypothetical protein